MAFTKCTSEYCVYCQWELLGNPTLKPITNQRNGDGCYVLHRAGKSGSSRVLDQTANESTLDRTDVTECPTERSRHAVCEDTAHGEQYAIVHRSRTFTYVDLI